MPTLTRLPVEITTLIATELETKEFFSFRLTSKELCSKTFNHFLSRHFSTRYHMLNRPSLRNLLEVSAHPVLGPRLDILEICVDHLTEDIPSYHPGTWDNPGDWESGRESGQEAVVNKEAYKSCLEDQRRFGKCGLDTAYLTYALVNLTNCKTVRISDTHQPWGACSQQRKTGVYPTSNMGCSESIVRLKGTIRVVLTAIIASQISLDHFEISTGFNREALCPELLPLRRDIFLCQPSPQLTHVTYLFLTIDPENKEKPDTWVQDLVSFLELFVALKQFGLCFYPRDELRRLGSLSTGLRLESLEFLSLAEADCAEDDLATLFRNHKDTLREIHLDTVDIVKGEGSWMSLERTVKEELSVEKFIHVDQASETTICKS